jgi:hypothetical protein
VFGVRCRRLERAIQGATALHITIPASHMQRVADLRVARARAALMRAASQYDSNLPCGPLFAYSNQCDVLSARRDANSLASVIQRSASLLTELHAPSAVASADSVAGLEADLQQCKQTLKDMRKQRIARRSSAVYKPAPTLTVQAIKHLSGSSPAPAAPTSALVLQAVEKKQASKGRKSLGGATGSAANSARSNASSHTFSPRSQQPTAPTTTAGAGAGAGAQDKSSGRARSMRRRSAALTAASSSAASPSSAAAPHKAKKNKRHSMNPIASAEGKPSSDSLPSQPTQPKDETPAKPKRDYSLTTELIRRDKRNAKRAQQQQQQQQRPPPNVPSEAFVAQSPASFSSPSSSAAAALSAPSASANQPASASSAAANSTGSSPNRSNGGLMLKCHMKDDVRVYMMTAAPPVFLCQTYIICSPLVLSAVCCVG